MIISSIDKIFYLINIQGRVDCIRSASTEALNWATAMCQGEGANVPLESDKEDDTDTDNKKVKFNLYNVCILLLCFSKMYIGS